MSTDTDTSTRVLPDDGGTGVARDGTGTEANGDAPARLADGIELVGRFEDSGFKEAPFIARRSDGQMVQMPQMLFALAEVVDGKADHAELARRFTERIERQVEPDMIATLLEEQLRPLGVVAPADGSTPELNKSDPLLALKFRTKVVPERFVHGLTTLFKPLFLPPVVILVVLAFLGLDVWLFGVHGVSQSLRKVIYDPALMFMLFGGIVVATTFHEIGHATGTRYGGAKPGVMGMGIYIVWPAFYTDITDAYRLGKGGRLRADLGGMYFNTVFGVTVAALYAVTGFEPLLLLIVLQTFAIVQQALPLLRLDGFYILSDLTGVPDMLTRIKPVLSRLIPGRELDPRVAELKPWVRRVVTGYVCTVVPIIALLFVVMLVHAPRAFATGYDSFTTHYSRVGPEISAGKTGNGIFNVFEMIILALPLMGMVYSTGRVGKRAGTGAWSWSAGEPVRRAGLLLSTAATVGVVAFLWWPNGEYRPIQPGEKGTLVSGVENLVHAPSGRASLTPERERQLGGAPFQRDARPQAGSSSAKETKLRLERRGNRPKSGSSTIPSPPSSPDSPAGSDPNATPDEGATPQDGNSVDPANPPSSTAPTSPTPPPTTTTPPPTTTPPTSNDGTTTTP